MFVKIVHAIFDEEKNSLVTSSTNFKDAIWYCITFQGPDTIETSDGSKWYRPTKLLEEQEMLAKQLNEVLQPTGSENLLDAARRHQKCLEFYVQHTSHKLTEDLIKAAALLELKPKETLAEGITRWMNQRPLLRADVDLEGWKELDKILGVSKDTCQIDALLDAARNLVGYVRQVRMTIEAEHSREFIEILQPCQDENLVEAAKRLAGEATNRERKLQDENASLEGQIETLENEAGKFKSLFQSKEEQVNAYWRLLHEAVGFGDRAGSRLMFGALVDVVRNLKTDSELLETRNQQIETLRAQLETKHQQVESLENEKRRWMTDNSYYDEAQRAALTDKAIIETKTQQVETLQAEVKNLLWYKNSLSDEVSELKSQLAAKAIQIKILQQRGDNSQPQRSLDDIAEKGMFDEEFELVKKKFNTWLDSILPKNPKV